jgi:hypothetical protein
VVRLRNLTISSTHRHPKALNAPSHKIWRRFMADFVSNVSHEPDLPEAVIKALADQAPGTGPALSEERYERTARAVITAVLPIHTAHGYRWRSV